jgi:hypothetical protein
MIKQVVAEEWEERVEAIGATFLGLTTACARCHDHKFDPITQHDYYALAGVLASIRQEDRPIVPNDIAATARAARERVKELQKQADELAKAAERSDEQREQLSSLRNEIASLRATPHFDTPLAYGVVDASIAVLPDGEHRTKIEWRPGQAQNVSVHIRGMASQPGVEVPRRYLSVLSEQPALFEQGSGRLELAQGMFEHSPSLVARVIVNRVWRHHFGRGLVSTPSNFGTLGDRPTHPELLDDLAARLIESGWSLKWLHREIMLSAAYQQSSERDETKQAIDPENTLLSRMSPRRLEIEAWRDAVLSATGEIDLAVGGEPLELAAADNRRRTLYARVKRRELAEMLRLHDFPDPVSHHAAREATTTPLQQLFVLNAPFLHERSEALVARLERTLPDEIEPRVAWLYPMLFGRAATSDEIALAGEFIAEARELEGSPREAWRQYLHALLSTNEFLFVD